MPLSGEGATARSVWSPNWSVDPSASGSKPAASEALDADEAGSPGTDAEVEPLANHGTVEAHADAQVEDRRGTVGHQFVGDHRDERGAADRHVDSR